MTDAAALENLPEHEARVASRRFIAKCLALFVDMILGFTALSLVRDSMTIEILAVILISMALGYIVAARYIESKIV